MTPERWKEVRDLLYQALELAPERRGSFLKDVGSKDESLRHEVESLLGAEEDVRSSFLQSKPAVGLVSGTRLGDYTVLSPLGAGGMGEVYRARDLRLRREVAIKVLPVFVSSDPERLRRFEQEAIAAAALNHPNILAVYQMGMYEGAPYLVSELLEGETLRERIKRGRIGSRKAIQYGVQIAHGLAAAHEKGIVHRDLKPENLFVTKNDRMKILDFGLAKLTQAQPSSQNSAPTLGGETEPGLVMGTVGYMAPEQVRGQKTDHRTDIFSFGATLYEMLTGARAFQKPTSAETMSAILSEEPRQISEIVPNLPPALPRVVHRCLEKNSAQRFQSASDLAFALEALSDSGSASTSHTPVQASKVVKGWIGVASVVLFTTILALWILPPAAVPVVQEVRQLTDDGEAKEEYANIETDGTRVYFTEKHAGVFRLAQVSSFGGQVAPVNTQIPAAYSASIAPDWASLLVSENSFGRHPIWLQPLPAGDARRLGDLEGQGVVFSPQDKIIYINGSALYVADQDGTNPTKLADLPSQAYWPAVSRDGKKIRVTFFEHNKTSIWEIASNGTNLRRMQLNPDFSGAGYGRWTPDGRYFVFQNSSEGHADIWVVAENPGMWRHSAPVRLTNGPLSCSLPTPSRDGKQVFARCAKLRGEVVRYDNMTHQFIPFLGGMSATDLMYSRDANWIVYLSYPDRSVWRMRADGTDRLRLTYPPLASYFPHISPDGTSVAFTALEPSSKVGLYTVNLNGGEMQKIVSDSVDPVSLSWSPDGKSLAFTGHIEGTQELGPDSSDIRVVNLALRTISTLPDSRGKMNPVWVTPTTLVAGSSESGIVRYDFRTQKWAGLAAGPFSDWDSIDGKYVYCTTMEPAPPEALRIRVSDGRSEPLADLSSLRRVVTYGRKEASLTPNGDLLFTRDVGTQEIYAFTVKWP